MLLASDAVTPGVVAMAKYIDPATSALRKIADQLDGPAADCNLSNIPFGPAELRCLQGLVGERSRSDIETLGATSHRGPLETPAPSGPTNSFEPNTANLGLLDALQTSRPIWRITAAMLVGMAAIGICALIWGHHIAFAWLNSDGKRAASIVSAPSVSSTASHDFSILRAVIAETVGADGRPHNISTSFHGRTPIAVLFHSQGGRPGKDVIIASVSGTTFERSCEPMLVAHPGATYWCQWEAIDPGEYKVMIRLNGAVVHETSFAIADATLSEHAGSGRLGRYIQSSFDCLRAEASVERTICENGDLARLEARMETLYRTARGQSDQAGQSRLTQQQTAFVSARSIKCGQAAAAELIPCLIAMTEQRIEQFEANQLPSFATSTAFADARKRLIALGWRPVTLASATPCPVGDVGCRSDLEMVVCSGGTPATCRHAWMRHGTVIEITTSGGEKSQVRSVICRTGCQ